MIKGVFLNYFLKKLKLPNEIIYKILCNFKSCCYCKEIIFSSVFCNKCKKKWEENLYNNYLKKFRNPIKMPY